MTPTWTTRSVLIAVKDVLKNNEPRMVDVPADIYGALAVHPTSTLEGWSPSEWTVTHVPTGQSVYRFFKTREQAKRCAEAFSECGDWGAATTPEATMKFAPAVIDILEEQLAT